MPVEEYNKFSHWFITKTEFDALNDEGKMKYVKDHEFTACEASFVYWAIIKSGNNDIQGFLKIRKLHALCPCWEREHSCVNADKNPLVRRYYPLFSSKEREKWKPNPAPSKRMNRNHIVHTCKSPKFMLIKLNAMPDASTACAENYKQIRKRIQNYLKLGAKKQGDICYVITQVPQLDSIQEFITQRVSRRAGHPENRAS